MKTDKIWGGPVILQSFCDCYHYNLVIFQLAEGQLQRFWGAPAPGGAQNKWGVIAHVWGGSHYQSFIPSNLRPTQALIYELTNGPELIEFNHIISLSNTERDVFNKLSLSDTDRINFKEWLDDAGEGVFQTFLQADDHIRAEYVAAWQNS